MKRRTALAVGATALAGCAGAESIREIDTDAAATQIRAGINNEREFVDQPTLPADDGLATTAREHSADMGERDFYAHENPDGLGPSDRANCPAGENIHRGEIGEMRNVDSDETWYVTDAEALAGYVVEGWVLSEGHYELMTDGRWSRMGVGVAIVDGEFFATALFC